MNKQVWLEKSAPHLWLLIPALLVASMAGSLLKNNGPANLYAYQAQAFLSGRLDIEGNPEELPGETVEVNGRLYVPFPPFPALVLTPFVALSGIDGLKLNLIAALIACISCFILHRILLGLGIPPVLNFWIMAAFGLGTVYWPVLRTASQVWMFAQIVFVLFALLSIHEALGRSRGWLAGLLLGLAFLSRQFAVYTAIFILAVLWDQHTGRQRAMKLLEFMAGLGICILIYVVFNYLRWGTLETGYASLNVSGFGKERIDHYGVFSAAYLFFNSVYMFLQGFHLEFGGPDRLQLIGLDPFGTSLLGASPFVVAAFRARWKPVLVLGSWLAVGFSLLHMLFYHNNGYIQFNGQRFTLDFLPVMSLLVALGFRQASPDLSTLLKVLVVYSIILNVLVFLLAG